MNSDKLLRVAAAAVAAGVAGGSRVVQAAAFAVPDQTIVSDTTSSAMRVPLALMLVIGMVLGAAWLMRRVTGQTRTSAQRLQIVAQVQLGSREKAVLLRVSGQDILLGVAPGNVRLITATPTATDADASEATAGSSPLAASFKDILRRSLGR